MFNIIYQELKVIKNNLRWSGKESISANINGVLVVVTLDTSFEKLIKKVCDPFNK